jgi:hypothetical protein
MRNVFLIISLCSIFIYSCQRTQSDKKIVTNLGKTIADTTFIKTLDYYIYANDESYKSKFIQVFINYEQNISRYIFFKTKSSYDLNNECPDDYFYYNNHLMLIYSGLNHLLKNKNRLPPDLKNFVEPSELFKDVDSKGNFTFDFNSGNIPFGNNIWELKVYHSFKDSIVLNKHYEGIFIWDGSRVKLDTTIKFVPPIIYEDKIDGK